MKPAVKIFVALVFAAIYCFAIAAVGTSSAYAGHANDGTAGRHDYFAAVSVFLHGHTALSEKAENNFSQLNGAGFKTPLSEWFVLTRITKQLFQASFKQYVRFSRNFLARYPKSDLIYPFHYHW